MKRLFLGTVAAAALFAAPVSATAQERMNGEAATSERQTIDAKLDRAETPGDRKPDRSAKADGERKAERARLPEDDLAAAEGQADEGGSKDALRDARREERTAKDLDGSRSERKAAEDRSDRNRDRAERMDDRRDRDSGRERAKSKSAKDDRARDRDRTGISASVEERARDRSRIDVDTGRSRSRTMESVRTEISRDRRDRGPYMRAASVEREGRASVRQRFASDEGAPTRRVSRERFEGRRIEAGVEAPRAIAVERVPTRVVEVAPEYRDEGYFETEDDRIVIVDPQTYKVITVIED